MAKEALQDHDERVRVAAAQVLKEVGDKAAGLADKLERSRAPVSEKYDQVPAMVVKRQASA
jgi:HEAT repeat protein